MSDWRKALMIGVVVAVAPLALAACSDNDNDGMAAPPTASPPPPPPPPPPPAGFTVTVSNLTNAQPLSPVAVIAHQEAYSVFTVGEPATVGLEYLAEDGDNSFLIDEATNDANVIGTASGAAPIGPAGSEAVTLEVLESDLPGLLMSVSTMLVNTNDAISGVNGVAVADMAVGDVVTLRAVAYDAGTEADTEAASDIPGPAAGGEGFNPARDDAQDFVAMHSGVVSGDDGLATSDLTGQHKFDNPVVSVRIERTN